MPLTKSITKEIKGPIIIGGGPAGITCALQLHRYGLKPLLLEKRELGGLLWNANLVENYPGFPNGVRGEKLIGLMKKQIERIGVEVKKICHQKPWSDRMAYVMSLPGFGVITAMTVLAAIGEIERFETPKKLASYSGLTPGLEQSGTKNRGKGITKEGRRELRWALVEAALQAVKSDPLLKHRFNELQKRMHRNQAIVSIARHLLELIWYVLTRHQPYCGFTQERIAYKYLTWAWQMKDAERDGLTRQQFARYYLMRLGIGKDLTRIALDPKHPRRLASEAEVLALRPELRQIE